MDGVLGRANALCMGTLWHAFKLAMIPLGLALARVYPPASYAAVLVNALVVVANGLPPAWYALALVVAITSTALELRSPTPPARPPRRLSCPPTPSRRPRPRGPTARPSR